jgi:hypothetical protein
MVNWDTTTGMITGLSPVAEALVSLIIAFFPVLVVGALLGMILDIFQGVSSSFGRGFRF